MSGLNQKEYLKKYLGIGKGSGEKKKKKKSKKTSNGLRIVDDDIGVNLNDEIKVDLAGDNEDAPQIVSVIDDRPPSLRIDEVTQNNLWKPLGAPDTISDKILSLENSIKLSTKSLSNKNNKNLKESHFKQPQASNRSPSRIESRSTPVQKYRKSDDFSPPRRSKLSHNSDSGSTKGPDNSPLRRKTIREDISPLRRKRADSDTLPEVPTSGSGPDRHKDTSTIKKVSNSDDSSPPRKTRRERSIDNSPPRRNRNDVSSPLRKIKREKSEDISPPRKNKTHNDNDRSPPRRIKREKSEDNSPPRSKMDYGDSPPRRIKRHNFEDSSPRRQKCNPRSVQKSRWGDREEHNDKLKKTLDGKTAGLQNAADLVLETHELKEREDELFKNMSAEVSGANAATVVRGKKKEVDWEEEERRRKKEEENKEKYNKWGKGLKQVEDINEKIKNEQYEMSKPLARYADDADLEKYLKDQEREGDPMLAYLRQKKRKKTVEKGKPVTQEYEGDAPPNRFGIRPGYRWDGVDRSGGYEKQWFQVQNSRMASLEESYKWSTEDM